MTSDAVIAWQFRIFEFSGWLFYLWVDLALRNSGNSPRVLDPGLVKIVFVRIKGLP